QWMPADFPAALLHLIDSHTPFAIDAVAVEPFPVPHDAREPVQYVFSDGAARLGVVTDLGTVTQHVVDKLSHCEALVIECNHDLDSLMEGPFPPRSSSASRGGSAICATPTRAPSSPRSRARPCATSSRRTFRSRTTGRISPPRRSRARWVASRSGSASPRKP